MSETKDQKIDRLATRVVELEIENSSNNKKMNEAFKKLSKIRDSETSWRIKAEKVEAELNRIQPDAMKWGKLCIFLNEERDPEEIRTRLDELEQQVGKAEAEVNALKKKYEPKCKCLTCGKLEHLCEDHAMWVEDCPSYINIIDFLRQNSKRDWNNNMRLVKENIKLKSQIEQIKRCGVCKIDNARNGGLCIGKDCSRLWETCKDRSVLR
jgi:hypothetical protein